MSRAVKHDLFQSFASKFWLTGYVEANIKLYPGVHKISPEHPFFEKYVRLISKANLAPLTPFQIKTSCHYVIVVEGQVTSGLSVMYACIKKRPMSLCASVEVIVSTQSGDGSILLDMVRAALVKRKGACFLMTQAANTHKAKTFWSKKACVNKEAKWLAFMLFCLNRDYRLCCDTSFMMLPL